MLQRAIAKPGDFVPRVIFPQDFTVFTFRFMAASPSRFDSWRPRRLHCGACVCTSCFLCFRKRRPWTSSIRHRWCLQHIVHVIVVVFSLFQFCHMFELCLQEFASEATSAAPAMMAEPVVPPPLDSKEALCIVHEVVLASAAAHLVARRLSVCLLCCIFP